ncbi:MAG: MBL fold metallo-hydrolase [Nonomuraea sp.]|nr:MBL fold metallo-hydrolase [Nonomuraea sp.]NUP65058.1 MBL fold metallo-hydrolase [Nonomuraea sp.]NUP81316.1 MBL fold metallo-hydrolase [Nonomuraea sp.]NUS09567.1 MBL fold metallo-hydrolase [Nonomuraea sp.]NUT09478.1 MBL fold metallo-hydrolase [Nonomuraea sp.]
MHIHHLNCGSVRKIEATYDGPPPAHAVNHCLLVETPSDGLVLVETGLGLGDVRDPAATLGADWVQMAEPVLAEEETAVRQIARLGYAPEDVRHVIVTHLDVDHCGGLPDFPGARVHVLAAELEAALSGDAFRYRPAHWAHGPDWVTYTPEPNDDWFGFTSIRPEGLPEEIRLIPLGGHTAGHTGVAVREGDRWLLHGGDAYYYHRELQPDPHPHPLMDLVQTSSEVHHDLRLGTQARLRELVRDHGDQVTVFSAHDPWELAAALAG